MGKPRIFLGSSGKQAKLLQALTRGLEEVAHVEPWTTSFNPGTTTLERLLELTREVDFAAFVFARDDWTAANATAALARIARFWRVARASWFLDQLRARADAWSLRWPSDETAKSHQDLTRREHEVARLVAKGLTNRDIAAQLSVSVRTAESHVEQIRSKLGFRTRAQIASWVTARGGAAMPS